ncbi:MAG TPA: HlyD family efflux transporter periplasmic adaptor subunit [Steroidobacteraceae bacterium]|nr:HlyD family efflux transporter periplasmic adaptor subunit [Steroidobacteraceae bacterium]
MSDPAPTAAAPPPRPGPSTRRRLLQGFAAILVVIGIAVLAYVLLIGRYRESTDDAYVVGNLVQVTPQTGGTVVAIRADDTDFVAAGQPLVEIDRADARVALDQAEAQLAKTVRDVRALYASTDALRASLEVRNSELTRARDDLARRESLASTGAVSGEELEHARAAVAAAIAAQASARQQWESNRAQTEGTDVASHPLVQQAAARVRESYLAYARSVVLAPVSGYVARRTVQVGERVQPGATLLVIVPLDGVWVEANLKESQLRNLRIGQPARLDTDLYGGSVEYHGRIEGLAAGTGSVFSLLPAQNATGNWIKVVQRLPVRITLDRDEVKAHPLRVGLSVRVVVDTRDRGGGQLAGATTGSRRFESATQDSALVDADARIAAILRANAPSPAQPRPSAAGAAPRPPGGG